MERYSIESQVRKEIEDWQKEYRRNVFSVRISPQAVDFITELIANISEDPSPLWQKRNQNFDDFSNYQRTAIANIPEALDYIVDLRRFRFNDEITISSWEIWQSLTRILVKFCFIPEKDM
ncbi:hypothetical protein GCM10022246_15410 [Pedobacter ginsengiterrae]|uniref:Uncharacterized protein n=1 Tax=Pedobacter ginsengiterrae TaxID=871696 RepID=A0ABP7PBV6_9SPHI